MAAKVVMLQSCSKGILLGDRDDFDMMVMVIKWWMIVIMVILC